MLSRFWRYSIQLYRETVYPDFIAGANLRSVQGPFEDAMHARAFLEHPKLANYPSRAQVERYVRTLKPNPTRPAVLVREPDIDLRHAGLVREVRRALAQPLGEATLLAYGYECVPRRSVYGPWGNVAHLTARAAREFQAARKRSHRRQRELGEYLDMLQDRHWAGDAFARAAVERIARDCDVLLEQADRAFMRGVPRAANAAA